MHTAPPVQAGADARWAAELGDQFSSAVVYEREEHRVAFRRFEADESAVVVDCSRDRGGCGEAVWVAGADQRGDEPAPTGVTE